MNETTEATEPDTRDVCAVCGEHIERGAAFITNADDTTYHPECYPEPDDGEPDTEDTDTLDLPEPEAKPARKASK